MYHQLALQLRFFASEFLMEINEHISMFVWFFFPLAFQLTLRRN